jgi:RNA polymerase sigma-70 factor (ECF subfamily)
MRKSDFRFRQVVPFGKELPIVIDCVPDIILPMPSGFHTTSWTLVQSAAAAHEGPSRDALGALCQAYWPPVYAFIRRRGYETEEARDLTQGFFALLLEKNYLTAADRRRGKFRSFLLTAVKHFLSNERDRAYALKRGGGQVPVLIDLDADGWHPPSATEKATPEVLFERRWALSLLQHVMTKLRSEFASSGKDAEFDKLLPFLNKSEDAGGYDTVATEIGVSAGALRMAVLRMRRRYRELMRSEIAETVSSPDEIDEEIRFLMSVLST